MADVLKEAWIWLLLAFVIGVAVGYFLRKYTVRERVTTEVTSAASEADAALAAERDAHAATKAALDECRAGSEPTVAASGASATATSAKASTTKAGATKASTAAKAATAASAAATKPATKPAAKKAAPALDLAAGKAVLGVTVRMDDLKLIEGIGPKIDGLMRADGITTWAELSKANVERLRAILDAAGPRYNIHDPGSWPKQARLLAAGKWQEFKELTDSLKGGR